MMSSQSMMMLQLLVIASTVSVETIAKPDVHSVGVSGYNVELHCDANRPSSTRWMSTSIWSAEDKTISIGHRVNNNLPDRHRYGFHSNDSRQLSISDAKLTDAGTFRCLEDGQDVVNIQLTVLAAKPCCSTNVSLKSLNVSDVVQIRCQVDYSGRLHPAVNCHSEVGNKTLESTAPNKTGNSTFRHVEFMFNVVIDDVIHNTKFHCTTFFMSPDNTSLLYNNTWTSSTVTVYGIDLVSSETTTVWSSSEYTSHSNTRQGHPTVGLELVVGLSLACVITAGTLLAVILLCIFYRSTTKATCRSGHVTPDVVPVGDLYAPIIRQNTPEGQTHLEFVEVTDPTAPPLPGRLYGNEGLLGDDQTTIVGPQYAELEQTAGSARTRTRIRPEQPAVYVNSRSTNIYAAIDHKLTR